MESQTSNGYVDRITGATIDGWAQDATASELPAIVEIHIDGQRIACVSACIYREDLQRHSIRDGYAGFVYRIPAKYCDDATHVISCKTACDGEDLNNSPIVFQHSADPARVTLTRSKQIFATLYSQTELAESIAKTRKLAVISTYHELDVFLEYHKMLFNSLATAGYTCLVVHNCSLFDARLTLEGKSRFLIARRNVGYDFGSYATGLSAALPYRDDLDEMLFVNDSIIQTSHGLGGLLARVRAQSGDMVGLIDSFERAYHLQSYFVWVGKRVIESPFLANFFATCALDGGRAEAIEDGELALTSCALSEGFKVKALCPYESVASTWLEQEHENRSHLHRLLSNSTASQQRRMVMEQFENTLDLIRRGIPVNPSHFFWDTLLTNFNIPFLKRELLLKNPAEIASYVRLPEILGAFPDAQLAIREARRRFGGERVPPLRLEPESNRPTGSVVVGLRA